jgi:hypothetical protein
MDLFQQACQKESLKLGKSCKELGDLNMLRMVALATAVFSTFA